MKKKIAILHPNFGWGGGEAVCVWIIKALIDKYDIDLIVTGKNVTISRINQFYQTGFKEDDFNIIPVLSPLQGYFLKFNMIQRYFKNHQQKYHFAISSNNEMDFGKRGIQYIHYPILYENRSGLFKKIYKKLLLFWSQFHFEGMRNNLTLTNSIWTKKIIIKHYDLECRVLYPSVVEEIPILKEVIKGQSFVCIGRIARSKELGKIIRILSEVKKNFPEITLDIIGYVEEREYFKRIKRIAEDTDWVKIRTNLSRAAMMKAIMKYKYGIHGMKKEHFGIAVLEMIKAGIIPFVPNDGGQVEIVANKHLIYGDEKDAVQKIKNLLGNPSLQEKTLKQLQVQNKRFSREVFVKQIREIVDHF